VNPGRKVTDPGWCVLVALCSGVAFSGCLATARNKGLECLLSRHMLIANCISAYALEQLKSVISTYVLLP